MKKIGVTLGCLWCLAACATQPTAARYEDELAAWLGQSEENLYDAWGYPNVTYSVGENSFIATYIKLYRKPVDGDFEPYADNMTYSAMKVPSFGLPPQPEVFYCKTSFVITNGVVSDYNFNGDDCVR